MRQPTIVGHRGFASIAPENTLVSYAEAIRAGAQFVECDVHLTADGVPVVVHDSNLKRTTGFDAEVRDVDSRLISQLDAGSWKSPVYAGERVPTLEQLLALTLGKAVLAIELKAAEMEDKVKTALENAGAKPSDVIIFAWEPKTLSRMRELEPELSTIYLVEKMPTGGKERLFKDAEGSGATGLGMNHTLVDEAFIRDAHARDLEVFAWTVNEPKRMRQLAAWGIDTLISDDPALAIQTVGRTSGA